MLDGHMQLVVTSDNVGQEAENKDLLPGSFPNYLYEFGQFY